MEVVVVVVVVAAAIIMPVEILLFVLVLIAFKMVSPHPLTSMQPLTHHYRAHLFLSTMLRVIPAMTYMPVETGVNAVRKLPAGEGSSLLVIILATLSSETLPDILCQKTARLRIRGNCVFDLAGTIF